MNSSTTEAEQWRQFKLGDHAAFETLFRQHYPGLFRFALRICLNQELSEQCIQELFVRLWDRRSQIAEVNSPRAYLFTALRRELLSQLKCARQYESLESLPSTTFVYSAQDQCIIQEEQQLKSRELTEALNALSTRQREAVYLKFYEELDYQEVAGVMNINYQSVVNLIYQALTRLKVSRHIQHYAEYYRLIAIPFLLVGLGA